MMTIEFVSLAVALLGLTSVKIGLLLAESRAKQLVPSRRAAKALPLASGFSGG